MQGAYIQEEVSDSGFNAMLYKVLISRGEVLWLLVMWHHVTERTSNALCSAASWYGYRATNRCTSPECREPSEEVVTQTPEETPKPYKAWKIVRNHTHKSVLPFSVLTEKTRLIFDRSQDWPLTPTTEPSGPLSILVSVLLRVMWLGVISLGL